MLFDVYRCVQLNGWSVVCGCVIYRVQRGEVWCVSSTLCKYDIRMGLLFGSELGEGATCFSEVGELGRGDLGGVCVNV